MFNAYAVNTLEYDPELCINCGMCIAVCPHGVFEADGRVVRLAHPERCMECGACRLNCPVGAIVVESGVGCAAALMYATLTGRPQAEECCGGPSFLACCGGDTGRSSKDCNCT